MKRLIITIVTLLCTCSLIQAQNSEGKLDDKGRISLAAFVPEQAENIPVSARQKLSGVMAQIATQNGLGASGLTTRFCIVPMLNVLSKDITETAPPMQVITLEVIFYIVDAQSQQIFSQTSVTVKGVGQSEDKAFMKALQGIKPKAGQFKGFVETGKTKIIEYYNSQCDVVIQTANALAGQRKYEEALSILFSVPDVCRECYDKCLNLAVEIYSNYANYKCTEYMAGAKAAYANMNVDKAAEFLGKITPDMECYEEAVSLVDEIKEKQLADGANVWDFKMKQYDDQIEKDKMMINAGMEVAKSWSSIGAAQHFNWDWSWLYGKK